MVNICKAKWKIDIRHNRHFIPRSLKFKPIHFAVHLCNRLPCFKLKNLCESDKDRNCNQQVKHVSREG